MTDFHIVHILVKERTTIVKAFSYVCNYGLNMNSDQDVANTLKSGYIFLPSAKTISIDLGKVCFIFMSRTIFVRQKCDK